MIEGESYQDGIPTLEYPKPIYNATLENQLKRYNNIVFQWNEFGELRVFADNRLIIKISRDGENWNLYYSENISDNLMIISHLQKQIQELTIKSEKKEMTLWQT